MYTHPQWRSYDTSLFCYRVKKSSTTKSPKWLASLVEISKNVLKVIATNLQQLRRIPTNKTALQDLKSWTTTKAGTYPKAIRNVFMVFVGRRNAHLPSALIWTAEFPKRRPPLPTSTSISSPIDQMANMDSQHDEVTKQELHQKQLGTTNKLRSLSTSLAVVVYTYPFENHRMDPAIDAHADLLIVIWSEVRVRALVPFDNCVWTIQHLYQTSGSLRHIPPTACISPDRAIRNLRVGSLCTTPLGYLGGILTNTSRKSDLLFLSHLNCDYHIR